MLIIFRSIRNILCLFTIFSGASIQSIRTRFSVDRETKATTYTNDFYIGPIERIGTSFSRDPLSGYLYEGRDCYENRSDRGTSTGECFDFTKMHIIFFRSARVVVFSMRLEAIDHSVGYINDDVLICPPMSYQWMDW